MPCIHIIVIEQKTYSISTHLVRFDTDQKCFDYLVQTRWNGRPQCHKCGNNHMNYYISTRKTYKCSSCCQQFSITQGTIFEKSKIPLTKWFMAIYFFTTMKRGVSSCQLAKMLGIQQKSAWFLLQRLRVALKNENNIVLQGVVEADETFVGAKIQRDLRLRMAKISHDAEQEKIHGMSEYKRNRYNRENGVIDKGGRPKGATKAFMEQKRLEKGERTTFERHTVVFGMMEKEGNVVMKILGNNRKSISSENIYPLLKKHIANGSTLITDEAGLYTQIDFLNHLSVNHKRHYVTEEGVHINNIENAWKHLKKAIDGTYSHISSAHFEKYLNENTYRWNRRNESEQSLFDSFIPLISGKRVTYEELTNRDETRLAA
ncbi:MAG: IS1595 family transposase [Bacteroidota bacterium]